MTVPTPEQRAAQIRSIEAAGVRIDNVNTLDTAQQVADEVNFAIRHARRGGVHG